MSLKFEDIKAGKVRLVFGDQEQIQAIKDHQRQEEIRAKTCVNCDGEGVVQCPACDGTGEKSIKK